MLRPLLLLAGAGLAPGSDRPNVLFVMADDLTASALGCYGNAQCRTPNLDRLAARGARFTRAYCQFPVCGPSRAAVMSGMYPQAIGVTGNGGSRKFTENLGGRPSLPQLFRRNGWTSARIGKIYHMRVPGDITAGVDGPDHAESWDERFNCAGLEWMTPGRFEHLSHEKLRRFPNKHYGLGFGTAFFAVESWDEGADQPDARAADVAVEWLGARGDQPFFLAVGFVRPHVPLVAPQAVHDLYPAESLTLAPRVEGDRADIPAAGLSLSSDRIGVSGRPDEQRRILRAYYASVTFMDAQVGRLLDALDELGLTESTAVVFSSDHGYHLGEHGLWQKLSLHEESARIPLLIAGPGIEAGERGTLAEQIDLFPTLAELAGLPVPDHCQGASLAPALRDPAAVVREEAYCLRSGGHLLRTRDWAYMQYPDGAAELYDMRRDPRQFTNLADSPEHDATREELARRLERKLAAIGG